MTDFSLVTQADRDVLNRQTPERLACMSCELNAWEWPPEFADPEPTDHDVRHKSRRSQLRILTEQRAGQFLVSKTWNQGPWAGHYRMSDAEFLDFWQANFEGGAAAKARWEERLVAPFVTTQPEPLVVYHDQSPQT